MCKMIELDNEQSASLFVMVWVKWEVTQTFTSGLRHTQMIQCDVKWFNREANGLRHTQIIQCDVEWFNQEANGLRHTQMIQCDVEWLSNDCINKAELSYLSFYLRAGRSFDVKVVAILRKLRLF